MERFAFNELLQWSKYIMLKLPMNILIIMLLSFPMLCINAKAEIKQNNNITISEMVSEMIMVGFRGLHPDDAGTQAIIKDIKQGYVKNIILFDYDVVLKQFTRNIKSPSQLTELITSLQDASPNKLFIAIDQEGGNVQRLKAKYGFTDYPSAKTLGLEDNIDKTYTTAYKMGLELASYGFNLNFAPCLDVDINPKSPVIGAVERSFSSSAQSVTKHGKQVLKGFNDAGIIGGIKHFPGHGSATKDSHFALPSITNTWQESELYPYKSIINDTQDSKKNYMIMIAHLFNSELDSKYPTSLSKATIDDLLRKKLNWQGVIISDDFQMKALDNFGSLEERIYLAINAGIDILIFGNNLKYDENIASKVHSIILELVNSKRITPERIKQSWERIIKLKRTLV